MDNKDNNILDDDLRQLKDGAAELKKKLGGQTIISDFGACTDAVRKVSGLKKDYLTNAVTLLLFGAPATAFILKTSCGFSWWFCGALWVLMGILAPADSFYKFRMLQKIDFAGDSMLECGRKLAAYKTYFMKGRKRRWPAAVLFALWAIAEALFVVPEEARKDTLIILALGTVLMAFLAFTVLIPDTRRNFRAIDSFIRQVEEMEEERDNLSCPEIGLPILNNKDLQNNRPDRS